MMPHENPVPISVLMVAIGGYGFHYLKALLDAHVPASCILAGIVDPAAEQSLLYPVVSHLGVPTCATIEEFYQHGHYADLAVISSPIHWHVPQSLIALAQGSTVLCDKPICAAIQEAHELIAARNRAGGRVMIGYQWSFSAAIQELKRDILSGLFGRPIRCSTLCCWPRDWSYYSRNDWAGRLRHEATGRWVLDSPANNAMAHFLHNLLFLLGPAMHLSAQPESLQAELYRARPIESFDTVACRVITSAKTELLFYASHVTERAIAPCFRLEFEDAAISCGESDSSVEAVSRTGRRKSYGAPDDTPQFHKLAAAIDYASGVGSVICGPEAAMAQTLCINGMHDSVCDVPSFPEAVLGNKEDTDQLFVKDLDEILLRCYRIGTLPGERQVAWAATGRTVDLAAYRHYPGGTK
jgi:predicted dehydrogenase